MLCIPYQRDARSFRFPLPNRIWTHHLRVEKQRQFVIAFVDRIFHIGNIRLTF